MPLQVISLLILLWSGSLLGQAWADEFQTLESPSIRACYDFSKKIAGPPKKPSTLPDAALPQISKKSGFLKNGVVWAEVRGEVGQSIPDLVKEISEHQAIRSKRVSEMSIAPLESSDYLLRQKVTYVVTPFLFVKVSWIEDWAFSLDSGTREDPHEVSIYYEKTEGTSHIKHLCGAFILRKIDQKITDVFIYEEAKATSRTQEDTQNGLVGTLRTFRYGPSS